MFYFNCVLLIDDDPLANLVHEELIKQFYISDEIKTVLSAQEALDFVNEFCARKGCFPELILVDINMPGLDGFEFVKKLKELPCCDDDNIKISALTSSSDYSDREFMKALGVTHYIVKPLNPSKIKELIFNKAI